METLDTFIKRWCVYSKTIAEPCMAQYEGTSYVFFHGYPSTKSTFIILLLKAVFGAVIRLRVSEWDKVNQEVVELTKNINLMLTKDHEAYDFVVFIRNKLNHEVADFDKVKVHNWLLEIEKNLKENGTD